MKKTPIYSASRDAIREAILIHAFQAKAQKLTDESAAFAMEVYNDVYTRKERETMYELPQGWLLEGTYIAANFGGESGDLYFAGSLCYSTNTFRDLKVKPALIETRRKPWRDSRGQNPRLKGYAGDHPFTDRWRTLNHTLKELQDSVRTETRRLTDLLCNYRSFEGLISDWGEIETLVNPIKANVQKRLAGKTVPSLQFAELNKTLGLPPETNT